MSATIACRRLVVLGGAILVACGSQAAVMVRSSAPPRAHPSATATVAAGPAAPYRVWVRQAGRDDGAALLEPSGHVTQVLPLGVATSDWSRYYAVSGTQAAPVLRVLDPASGAVLRTAPLPPYFDLPSIGPDAMPEGLAPGSRHLVVTAGSTFLVLDAATLAVEQRVELSGDYTYDGISDDAANLYLIERINGSGNAR